MIKLTNGYVITSFQDLEQGLKDWSSFSNPDAYDFVAMFALFCACIDNLRRNALPAEIQDLGKELSDEERAFLRTMVESQDT